MENKLTIYNTLTRRKELFVPLHAPHVGMYVCVLFTVMLIWDTLVRLLHSIFFSVT